MNTKNKLQITSVLYKSCEDLKLVSARINVNCEFTDSNIDDFITDIPNNVNWEDLLIDVNFRVGYNVVSNECVILNNIEILVFIKDDDNSLKPIAILGVNKNKFNFDDREVIRYYLCTTFTGYQYHHLLDMQVNGSVSLLHDVHRSNN